MEIRERIAEVLAQHVPYEAISGRQYCRNRDCMPATKDEDAAWDWPSHVADVIRAEIGFTQVWSNDVAGPDWQRYSYWRTPTEDHPGPRRIAAGLT